MLKSRFHVNRPPSTRVKTLLILAFASAFGASIAPTAGLAAAPEGRYIVVLKDSVKHPGAIAGDQAEEVDGDVGFVYRSALKGYSTTMPKGEVRTLEDDPRVKYVTPDRKVKAFAQSTPTGIERTLATSNESLDIDGVDDVRIDADVAVIDTGIDFEHPDLNEVSRTNCVPAGKNPIFEELPAEGCKDNSGIDDDGHGTHVAGTVGALDNGFGVVGVAPGVRLWSVKVLTPFGQGSSGYESWIVAGVDWVTAHASEIEVANMSIGCPCSLPALEEAIETSTEAGVVYVVAAGNDAEDAENASPAKNPVAITVSALADYDGKAGGEGSPSCKNQGADDTLANFSNYGDVVDVVAPGVCIYSTYRMGLYLPLSGTSMASPHVAGAAAVLASQSNPNSLNDVEAIREQIVDEGSQAWADTSEDAEQEPLLDLAPSTTMVYTTAALDIGIDSATLTGGINPDGVETSYYFEYGPTTSYGTKVPAVAQSVGSGTSDVRLSHPIEGLQGHTTYHFRIVATSSAGTSFGEDRKFLTHGVEPIYLKTFGKGGSEPGEMRWPLGVATGPDGSVYVADSENNRIQRFSASGTFIKQFGSLGKGNGEFENPVSVDIDSAGNVYVVDGNARVQKFNANGEYLSEFGKLGEGEGDFSGPGGIAVDATGNIYVVDSEARQIKKFNSKGEYLSYFGGLDVEGHREGKGLFTNPMNIAIDSTGSIYVLDSEADRVQKFTSEGEYLLQFSGMGASGFRYPQDIAVDANDDVYVSYANLPRSGVQKFDSDGGFLGEFAHSGEGEVVRVGIDVNVEGDVYTTDSLAGAVTIWSVPPTAATEAATDIKANEAAIHATINPEGYATTYQFEYGKTTSYGSKIPISPKVVGSGVGDVAVSETISGLTQGTTYHYRVAAQRMSGTVYGADKSLTTLKLPKVESTSASVVQYPKFTLKGSVNPEGSETTYQFEYGKTTSYGSTIPSTAKSVGSGTNSVAVSETPAWLEQGTTYHFRVVAKSAAGTVYGTDATFKTLVPKLPLTPDPPYFTYIGSPGSGTGELSGPQDVAVDAEGNLYVADTNNSRIEKFNSAGEYLAEYGEFGSGEGQFYSPHGVDVDSEGNIYVADTYNSRIQKLNPAGEYLAEFGYQGQSEGDGELAYPQDIEVDAAGNVYVVDSYPNIHVQKFNSKGEFVFQFRPDEVLEGEGSIGVGGLALGPNGEIYVGSFDGVIRKFNSKGEYLLQVENSFGSQALAVDPGGNVYSAHGQGPEARIEVFGSDGKLLTHYVYPGDVKYGKGAIWAPAGLAWDPAGSLYIADSGNGEVDRWSYP